MVGSRFMTLLCYYSVTLTLLAETDAIPTVTSTKSLAYDTSLR